MLVSFWIIINSKGLIIFKRNIKIRYFFFPCCLHIGAGYHSESKAKEYKHVCKRACQKVCLCDGYLLIIHHICSQRIVICAWHTPKYVNNKDNSYSDWICILLCDKGYTQKYTCKSIVFKSQFPFVSYFNKGTEKNADVICLLLL